MNAQFPAKLQFLFDDSYDFKVMHSGRGAGKSWGVARWLLIDGTMAQQRTVCTREVQNSIQDSVLQLLDDQIDELGLRSFYQVQKTSIVGKNGTQFLFKGLRHNTVDSIKSIEGATRVWAEEAQTISKHSFDVLIPSVMRRANSQIIVTFNPGTVNDDVWKRFVLHPPPKTHVAALSWRDNPWFPEGLRLQKDHLLATDPKAYQHIWEGEPVDVLDGTIFATELEQAEKEGRIGNVPRAPMKAVDTYWDLGFGDCTAIWFAQSMPDGSIRVIDYLEDSGKRLEWYVVQIQQKGYLQGTDYLPHDGVDAIIHQKLGGGDPSMSIEMLLRKAGRRVRVAPKLHVSSRINAGRMAFPSCWFDRVKCDLGLHSLKYYQWVTPSAAAAVPDPRDGAPSGTPGRIPLHSWASHGSDAYQVLAVCSKTPQKTAPPSTGPPSIGGEHAWMG